MVANFALMHAARPDRVVAECARVLKPGGCLAISVWDTPARARVAGVFADAVGQGGDLEPTDVPAGPAFFGLADDDLREGLFCGMADVRSTTVSFTQHFGSAGELWDGMLGATVRTAAVIIRQPVAVRQRIREAYDRLVEPYATSDGITIPVSVKLTSCRAPG